jgi:hypothetical protein
VAPIVEPAAAADPPTTSIAPVERPGAEAVAATVADPVAIHIPSIGVDSALVSTGVLDDGTVAVPPDANIAGWFNGGPRPGERGPAVIMGHVDSARTGPGVFYRLRDIVIGDIVTIDTPDGPIEFVVERVEQHPKLEFPTGAVYGPTPGPTLRLVTCGGSFDRSVRSYYDNIIVFLLPRSTP